MRSTYTNLTRRDLKPKRKAFVSTSTLAIAAFATLFLARSFDVLGIPSLINFVHFLFIPLACGLALFQTKTKDRQQILATKALIGCLFIFLCVNFISAFWNSSALINVVLNYLLLAEPFLMLLLITSLPLSPNRVKQLKNWIAVFALYNLGLVYVQRYIMGTANADFLYGAFFSNAGATVSAIVSLVFAIYYLASEKDKALWLRLALLAAAFWQIIISDTKLVLGSFIVGYFLFSLSKVNSKTLIYVIFSVFLFILSFWAMQNIEFLRAYAIWLKPEMLTNLDSEFYRAKFSAFRVVPQYYDSSIDFIVGIGPGHGIGRLGGWMMTKYDYLLDPLGATHPYIDMRAEIMTAAATESRHVIGTAMYGPVFSWAGVWSELGLIGLGSYLLLWLSVWYYYCLHDFSKYLIMATFTTGFFPGYLEEPASMLFITFVIGLWWHEQRHRRQKTSASYQLTQVPLSDRAISPSPSTETNTEST